MVDRNPEMYWDKEGEFLANLLHFGRLLRKLDINVSSQQIYGLAEGITHIDVSRRDDFYNTARAFLLHENRKKDQFDQAFDLFWMQHVKVLVEFSTEHKKFESNMGEHEDDNSEPRIFKNQLLIADSPKTEQPQTIAYKEIEINPVFSSSEVLRQKDFSELNREELNQAKDLINHMVLGLNQMRTRRRISTVKQSGYLDFRRSLRNNLNYGGEIIELKWQRRKLKPRPLVVITDISGSMQRYSEIFLYFLYALVQRTQGLETFVFGTRLTHITPALRKRDIEIVLKDLSSTILDWSGGTRIGESLKEFNYRWSRRVLRSRAIVIIISDGWDRGDIELLDKEIGRLRRNVSRLIWLNPLADSPEYQPLVKGIQTVLPHVDEFYPLNNINSLESLAQKLSTID